MTASSFELIAPGGYAWSVTPSDSTVFTKETRGIYVGVGGDLAVKMYDPDSKNLATVTFASVPGGIVLPIRTKQILAATTAASIVAIA